MNKFKIDEITKNKMLIYNIIQEYNITKYSDLFLVLEKLNRCDLYKIVLKHSYFFKAVLKSKKYKKKDKNATD